TVVCCAELSTIVITLQSCDISAMRDMGMPNCPGYATKTASVGSNSAIERTGASGGLVGVNDFDFTGGE
ncbi:MAG: hypothetical protein WC868_08945, partial [Bacteroidales bacterium]